MIARAARSFADAVHRRSGDRLRGVYLFGSRARGDQKPFSDIDLAVVVDGSILRQGETKPLAEMAYDAFLETGAEVQPWLFAEVGSRVAIGQSLRSKADYSAESASRSDSDAALAATDDRLAFARPHIENRQGDSHDH
jgi:hypothetical protein